MYKAVVEGGGYDCYIPTVAGPEFLTHIEERTSIGMHVHEKKRGEVIAMRRLVTGSEIEHENKY